VWSREDLRDSCSWVGIHMIEPEGYAEHLTGMLESKVVPRPL
jgi:hypothetical protein